MKIPNKIQHHTKQKKLRLTAVLIPLSIVRKNSRRLEIKQNTWKGETIKVV